LELERQKKLTLTERNFAELLTLLIEAYEEKHYPIRSATPLEVLQELMTANDLRQKDLAPLFGSESIVSEVLSGKRGLNKRHIEKLSRRFKVSPELFFDLRNR
jgi:HTH-type transcriptional regulator/antitoxin HigA